jgi:hypothetical protein
MDRPARENTSGTDEVKPAMVHGNLRGGDDVPALQKAKLVKLQLRLPRADAFTNGCPTTQQLAHCLDIRPAGAGLIVSGRTMKLF